MFTYIRLKNFKSFSDVTIDFQRKKGSAKNVAIIFGSNGSGKTTIVQAFFTLTKLLGTMQVKNMLRDLLENRIVPPDDAPFKPEKMIDILKRRLTIDTIEQIIEGTKMKGSKDSMIMEFGFLIDGTTGKYEMEFDDLSLIHERLEYKILKNRGCCFDIAGDSIDINARLFETEEYLDEIKKQVKMFWGKHTLLSILMNEFDEKSEQYVNSNISANLMKVLNEFDSVSLKVKNSLNISDLVVPSGNKILFSLERGIIDKSQAGQLDSVERVLNEVFTGLFDDVNKVFYRKEEYKKEKLQYSLCLNKKNGSYDYDIDFKYESSGTQEILELMPFLMLAMVGKTVVIDEYGTGIHDLLSSRILNAIAKNMKGQLIVTSHNLMLMEMKNIPAESFYFIINDQKSRKSVKCVSKIETRLHQKYNYRSRYLTSELYKGGLPREIEDVQFKALAELYSQE